MHYHVSHLKTTSLKLVSIEKIIDPDQKKRWRWGIFKQLLIKKKLKKKKNRSTSSSSQPLLWIKGLQKKLRSIPGLTSGAYIAATVKVPMAHMRAPNNNAVVKVACWWKTRGRRKIQAKTNMNAIESLRPNLSTIMADKRIPGSSTT
jgi:hypothetical protein